MYGLVNQGIRKMVTQTFGADKWEAILLASGIGEDVFVAMDPYPDSMTLKLVGAASQVLELPPDVVLGAFGKWWIGNAAAEYGTLFTMTGSTFQEFITNLNDIHTRVAYMLPELTPPSFKVIPQSDSKLEVHYYSKRDGLFPMVQGMIEGIGEWFETDIEVSHSTHTDNDGEHDVFMVRYTQQ